MASNRNSRYYSQSYEPVENPGQAHLQSEGNFHDYQDYQGFKTVSDLDISEPLPPRQPKSGWNRRKIFVIGGAVAACVIIGLAVGLGVGLSNKSKPYNYTPVNGDKQVTSGKAFGFGATRSDPARLDDGTGAGKDEYTYYSGKASEFPDPKTWISFEDMWSGNYHFFKSSCHANGFGKDQTDDQISDIYDAIQDRARASLVDHRFILAIILQETHGCAKVESTTSSGGVGNPGLMQSNQGAEFSKDHASQSIQDMVQDGVQGTRTGDGLVQNLNYYYNAYAAARGYNSGILPLSGNLSEAQGATACYVSDVANRLTGWSNATTKCHED